MGQPLTELNDVQRLAIAQALYKCAAELVDTKNPDSLRSRVDRGYKELYEQTGSKSFDVLLNGQQVGNYSIRFSKPQPEKMRYSFEVQSYEDLAKWITANCTDDDFSDFIAENMEQFAEWIFNKTGEICGGCDTVQVITPAVEKTYLGGTLKIDAQAVQDATRDALPVFVTNLLGGAE